LANEQLREHDKMQTEFVNIAAHELRTPIQPILGMVELIKHRVSGQTKTEITDKQLAILERNAKRLQKLSAEILDATRIESGTLKLELEVVDINEKVRNAIADASSLIAQDQDTKIQFKPLTDESGNPIPLLVMADKLRMFQVISNLIRNAIKFSAEDRGIITVTTGKKDDQVVVSVKDQGEGISTEMLAKLFTKFSTDKEKGGTGLGLFIAKNIVEAHRGRIWAENNKDGNGATFAFTLPLADTEK
jgi:signal transduction histidine kinase